MKHTYLLNIKRDVKTVYLVVSSITDPSLVRGGRAGGKKKSDGDFDVVLWRLISAAMKKL